MLTFKANIAIPEDNPDKIYRNMFPSEVVDTNKKLRHYEIPVALDEKLVATTIYKPLDTTYLNFHEVNRKVKVEFLNSGFEKEGYLRRRYNTNGCLSGDNDFLGCLGVLDISKYPNYNSFRESIKNTPVEAQWTELIYERLPFALPIRFFKDKYFNDKINIIFKIINVDINFELTITRPIVGFSNITSLASLIQELSSKVSYPEDKW